MKDGIGIIHSVTFNQFYRLAEEISLILKKKNLFYERRMRIGTELSQFNNLQTRGNFSDIKEKKEEEENHVENSGDSTTLDAA